MPLRLKRGEVRDTMDPAFHMYSIANWAFDRCPLSACNVLARLPSLLLVYLFMYCVFVVRVRGVSVPQLHVDLRE